MSLDYIYALIVIECRLSKREASTLFRKNSEEMEAFISSFKGCDNLIYNALIYVFNSETIIPNERRDKKAITLATFYIKKLYNILQLENNIIKRAKLKLLVEMLSSSKTTKLFKKDRNKWTIEERKKAFKYQLKFAISDYDMSSILNMRTVDIRNSKKNLEDEQLKAKLFELEDYCRTRCLHQHGITRGKRK